MKNLLEQLKNSIYEESQHRARLIPIVNEIEMLLGQENYTEALTLIDELEEFMDLEFCS